MNRREENNENVPKKKTKNKIKNNTYLLFILILFNSNSIDKIIQIIQDLVINENNYKIHITFENKKSPSEGFTNIDEIKEWFKNSDIQNISQSTKTRVAKTSKKNKKKIFK